MDSSTAFFAEIFEDCLDFLTIQAHPECSTLFGRERILKFTRQLKRKVKKRRKMISETTEEKDNG